jgi:hypothetical protein
MVSSGRSGRISPDEFIARLNEIVAANIAGSTQLTNRFKDFIQEAIKADATESAGERMDAGALLSRWLDFNLASYSVMTTNSLALLNGLLTAAESTLIPKAAPAPAARPSSAPRVELRLFGRHGDRATSGFVLENHFDRPLSVTFESADLIPENGPPLPASLVSFEPATLVIPPRGQAVVYAAIGITRDFVVGQTYTTTLRLLGLEAKEDGLSVSVLPPADAHEPVRPAHDPRGRGES